MPMTVEIVTAERFVRRDDDVEVLVAPGSEGQLAILPRHAPLMTTLDYGVLEIRTPRGNEVVALTGGFMEVRNNRVTILADAAEPAEEIDVERAEAARARAEATLRGLGDDTGTMSADTARARAALLRSLARLRAAERMRRQGR
jgi:F-type H+-transporting ATPase subunit epsilon